MPGKVNGNFQRLALEASGAVGPDSCHMTAASWGRGSLGGGDGQSLSIRFQVGPYHSKPGLILFRETAYVCMP